MQKRLLGKTGEWASLLGFGCMRFPTDSDNKTDSKKVQKMVDYAKAHGINYFDTAYVYGDGESERAISKALSKFSRDSYFLADKLPLWDVKDESELGKYLETSLERLGTDYIDFYLIHAVDKSKIELIKKFHVIDFMKKKRDEGKIRHIGFSFHDTPEVLSEMLSLYDWEFVQLQINYLDWEAFRAKELYDLLAEKDIPCVVMEPIRGGNLAKPPKAVTEMFKKVNPDMSPAAWALNFCASQPQIKVILSGMSDFDQVKENIDTLGSFTPMNGEEKKVLNDAVKYMSSLPHVYCTGCEYCMPCPKGVNIPACFREYNAYIDFENADRLKEAVKGVLAGHGPEECVKCGLCKKKCPQHFDIPALLPKLTGILKENNI